MIRQHHRLQGHKSEQTLGDNGGQRSLKCCGPWSHRESDTTGQLSNNKSEIMEGRLSSAHAGNSERRRNRSLGGRIQTRKYNRENLKRKRESHFKFLSPQYALECSLTSACINSVIYQINSLYDMRQVSLSQLLCL